MSSNQQNEFPEVEYANKHYKEIEEYHTYAKTHREITNKLLDGLGICIEQFGLLYDHQSTLLNILPDEYIEEQSYSVNFITYIQGIMTLLREELVKGYAKQMEFINGEILGVKHTFKNNLKKPVDSLENMTTMLYQVKKLFTVRNQLVQRHQYIAFHYLTESLNSFLIDSPFLYKCINQLDELEYESDEIRLKGISYCNKQLSEILIAEKREKNQLPRVIEEIIQIISEKYMEREGIFRTAANLKMVDDIYHRLDVTDMQSLSCELLAALLKRFVRDIPNKLFDTELSQEILEVYRASNVREEKIRNLSILFQNFSWIPEEKMVLFKAIIMLCYNISLKSDINLMTDKNLAVCWAPNLFSSSSDQLPFILEMISFTIREAAEIFNEPKKPAVVIGTKRSPNQSQEASQLKSSQELSQSKPKQTNDNQQQNSFVVGTVGHNQKEKQFVLGAHNARAVKSKDVQSNQQSISPQNIPTQNENASPVIANVSISTRSFSPKMGVRATSPKLASSDVVAAVPPKNPSPKSVPSNPAHNVPSNQAFAINQNALKKQLIESVVSGEAKSQLKKAPALPPRKGCAGGITVVPPKANVNTQKVSRPLPPIPVKTAKKVVKKQSMRPQTIRQDFGYNFDDESNFLDEQY